MTIGQTIAEHVQRLPERLQVEVLDFVQFLEIKNGNGGPSASGAPGATGETAETSDSTEEPPPSLVSLIGSWKGLFRSPEEVDEFITRERNAWDS